jgi:uncharacterized membrane protein
MEQKGFLGSLFELSFSSMVTARIIQLLYALALIGIGLLTIVWIAAAFSASEAAGIIVLLFSPLIFLVMTIFVRVYLEAVIVLFKIAESTAEVANNTRRQAPPTS